MSKKYFVTSDIHSHYFVFIRALNESGFDLKNKEHILIIVGDLFDRGDESTQLYNFIKKLPKERRILIRGNHEDLLFDVVKRFDNLYPQIKNDLEFDYLTQYYGGYFNRADFSNGTVKTILNLAGIEITNREDYLNKQIQERAIFALKKTKILEWINSDEWCDWYELGQYIFTHAFIPLHNNSKEDMYSLYDKDYFGLSYFENWRKESSEEEIKESRWGCPWKLWKKGFFKNERNKGKILVVGHWHTSDFFNTLSTRKNKKVYSLKENPIYNKDGLIGLDACTAYTKKINILVINEEDLIWNQEN